MRKLGVNVDHIATLRQARGTKYPDPIAAAAMAESAGADQITVHLREDRRHIQDNDVWTLRKTVKTLLNLEMAAVDEILRIACQVRPDIATIVPERREELTTEGGLDVVKYFDKLRYYVNELKANSIVVSLFIDPDLRQVEASKRLEVESIEIHTGDYAQAEDHESEAAEIERIKRAAVRAKELGLRVVAGHGLNYSNTERLVTSVPEIVELNIGHSIVARAFFVGLAEAVREMKRIINKGVQL